MKFVVGITCIIAVMLILGGLGAIMAGIKDFRTDDISDQFIVSTNASSGLENVQLSHTLFDGDKTNASVASNITSDVPIVGNYTAGTRVLEVNGLGSNTTRTLTLSYKTAGLDNYTGADSGIRLMPVILVVGAVGIALMAMVYVIFNR